jgi:hypothetical protein
VHPEVGRQATDWLDRAGVTSKTEFRLLWLAIVLNNAKANLWSGPGKENVSINSFCSALQRWTKELGDGTMTIADYRSKLAKSGVSSRKGKKVVAKALALVDAATVQAVSDELKVTEIVNEVFRHCIMPLEIDVKSGATANDCSQLLFEIYHGVSPIEEARLALLKLLGVPH